MLPHVKEVLAKLQIKTSIQAIINMPNAFKSVFDSASIISLRSVFSCFCAKDQCCCGSFFLLSEEAMCSLLRAGPCFSWRGDREGGREREGLGGERERERKRKCVNALLRACPVVVGDGAQQDGGITES